MRILRSKHILLTVIFSFILFNFANASAYVEHNVQAFLKSLAVSKNPPMETLSPTAARAAVTQSLSAIKVEMPPSDISNKTIQVDGKPVQLTIVRPINARGVLPVFMFFHGGGWVLGDFPSHERLVRDLVNRSGAVAVFVNYSLSPEVHYPVAINQAYAATRWVAEHGNEINVDSTRMAVVGTSAGGNMAAVVSLMAKEKNFPPIKYQILFWPVTNADFNTNSYQQFGKGYFLTTNMMKWFWNNYTTDPKQRQEILASPLQATTAELQGLPPALVITAENDVLRDEGEAYAQKLDEAGVDVVSVRFNGMIHDFTTLNFFSKLSATNAAIDLAAVELKQHLK